MNFVTALQTSVAGGTTRRHFLKCAALAVGGTGLFAKSAPKMTKTANSATWAYVGTSRAPQDLERGKANGRGILLYEMNPGTGALTRRDFFPHDWSPGWLALARGGAFLY